MTLAAVIATVLLLCWLVVMFVGLGVTSELEAIELDIVDQLKAKHVANWGTTLESLPFFLVRQVFRFMRSMATITKRGLGVIGGSLVVGRVVLGGLDAKDPTQEAIKIMNDIGWWGVLCWSGALCAYLVPSCILSWLRRWRLGQP